MIDNYQILVPSFVESGTSFEVRVVARDASGNIVDDDSTVVTLSSSSPDIVFDSNENGTFGEVGDDQATLLNGIINIFGLDTKGTTFTVTADSTVGGITGSVVVPYNFNCITFQSETVQTPELSTIEHQKFIRGYGGVLERQDPTTSTTTLQENAFITHSGLS